MTACRDTLAGMAAIDPFANLPELTTVVLHFRAARPQRLPPLPTTAFHGTLGHALRDIACLAPQRKDCPGCPHLPLCPYAVLFEPRPAPDAGKGVTNRAPPPIVIAPEAPAIDREPLVLQQGDRLGVRLSLVGSLVGQHYALVATAMRKAGARGIGLPLDGSRRPRPPLVLEEVERVEDLALPASPARLRLRFVTPVRVKHDRTIRRDLDAPSLWSALTRRAALLSRLYGAGPIDLPAEPPFRVTSSDLRVVGVRRYSTRQRQRIDMPGLVGPVEIEGDLAGIGPLLRFAERVQIGKATTFGLGRFAIEDPCCSSSERSVAG